MIMVVLKRLSALHATDYYNAMKHLPPISFDIKPHDGQFINGRHYFACRVYFEDTDFSGVVYHANYLRYMERARSDMLRGLAMDQKASYDNGEGVYAVVDLSIKYIAPAKLDDDLLIITSLDELRGASVKMTQTIWKNKAQIVSASVQAAFLTPEGRPRRQPEAWTKAFRGAMTLATEN